jgi:hypothetical protein
MTKFSNIVKFIVFLAFCLHLAGSAQARAQDPQAPPPPQAPAEDKPKPAARTYGPIGGEADQDAQTPADTLQPDQRPLTGFQQPTVGTPLEKHSYWVPGVSYYNFVQSNGSTQGGGGGWNSTSYLTGNVSLLKTWSTAQLALNYSGGGNFSTDSALGNGWFQQFGASQTFNWERLQLTILDQFAYLPQAQFGFGAGTGIALPGVGGSLGPGSTGLGGGIDPGQSVFTTFGPRYTNVFGVQGNYTLTRRSSLTFGGIDSILRFTDPGNIESNEYLGSIGYNYQFTREDTLGLVYRYSSYHFIGFTQNIGDQSVQVAYGRKITGRLALQLTGGPEITHLRVAAAGGGSTETVAGTGSASITYAIPKGSLSGSYYHGVTAGSGVFLGSTTDQLNGAITRKITRVWTGNANLGYSRNRGIVNAGSTTNINYDTVYGSVSAGRALGRNANLSLGYTAYIERTNGGTCAVANCGSDFTTHQLSFGVSWHTRPLVLP